MSMESEFAKLTFQLSSFYSLVDTQAFEFAFPYFCFPKPFLKLGRREEVGKLGS